MMMGIGRKMHVYVHAAQNDDIHDDDYAIGSSIVLWKAGQIPALRQCKHQDFFCSSNSCELIT